MNVEYCVEKNELTTNCEYLFMHINSSLVEWMLNLAGIGDNTRRHSSNLATRLNLKLSLNHRNTYINFIDDKSNSIYTIGAKSIRLKSNMRTILKLSLENFLIFKSTRLKSENNLFATDLSDLVGLFERMNERKFIGQHGRFNHVWGNLMNVNSIKFTYRPSRTIKLFVDRFFMEYSQCLLDMIMHSKWVNKLSQLRSNKVFNSSVNDAASVQIVSLKLNQASVYFLFEKTYFIYASLNHFVLMRKQSEINNKNESFHLKLDQANCAQFRLSELETRLVINNQFQKVFFSLFAINYRHIIRFFNFMSFFNQTILIFIIKRYLKKFILKCYYLFLINNFFL